MRPAYPQPQAQTYIINLARSTTRWERMQPILAVAGFPNPRRWEACDGDSLDFAQLQADGLLCDNLSRFSPPCRFGEIGCALSHAAVLRDIVENRIPLAYILEDDILLAGSSVSFVARCRAVMADLPIDWELFYLYRCLDIRHRVQRLTPRLLKPWSPLGCAAYAVTLEGARKLLRIIEPVHDAIDRMIVDSAILPGLIKTYAASPLLILPGDQASIINAENPGRDFILNGVNRPPEYWPMRYWQYLGESHWRYWPPGKIAKAAGMTVFAAWLLRRLCK